MAGLGTGVCLLLTWRMRGWVLLAALATRFSPFVCLSSPSQPQLDDADHPTLDSVAATLLAVVCCVLVARQPSPALSNRERDTPTGLTVRHKQASRTKANTRTPSNPAHDASKAGDRDIASSSSNRTRGNQLACIRCQRRAVRVGRWGAAGGGEKRP